MKSLRFEPEFPAIFSSYKAEDDHPKVEEKPRPKITLKQLRAAYTYLRDLPPFCGKLPPTEQVEFKIVASTMVMGYYEPDPHTIAISRATNDNHDQALRTMAHECVHLLCERLGLGKHENHDAESFGKYAAQVCHTFGWSEKDF